MEQDRVSSWAPGQAVAYQRPRLSASSLHHRTHAPHPHQKQTRHDCTCRVEVWNTGLRSIHPVQSQCFAAFQSSLQASMHYHHTIASLATESKDFSQALALQSMLTSWLMISLSGRVVTMLPNKQMASKS